MSEIAEKNETAAMSQQILFCGEHRHTLDDRKRLTIPADWRAMIGEPERLFVIKSVHGPYLQVLPMRVASQRMSVRASASIMSKTEQEKNKIIAKRTEVVPWDAQGRVRLRDDVLAHAGITDKVLLTGTIGGFEVWRDDTGRGDEKTGPTEEEIMTAFTSTGL